MATYNFGRIADLPDQRDHVFSLAPQQALPFPSWFRVRNFGVENQLNLNSCVGHGTVGAFRQLLAHHGLQDFVGSRLGLYYCARSLEGSVQSDIGCSIRDGVKAAATIGVMPEVIWPYDVSSFAVSPPAAAYAEAQQHLALEYQSVDNTSWDAVRASIYRNGNLIIGVSVYESFVSQAVARSGMIPVPKITEKLLGGHCMRAIGYTAFNLIVVNSWGPGWGDLGFCYIPRAIITNPQLTSDCWTLARA